MRKIAVVSGTRAEYGYLKPLMEEIKKDNKLELVPIATGMHLLPEFGNTFKIIEKDFKKIVKIPMRLTGDKCKDTTLYLSSGIKNFGEYFNDNPSDILVVLGDRVEALAAALAALFMNIPIAHINGGDVSGGTVDESIRHAITKIAHIHFAHTKGNALRIKKMGEDEKRIFLTGALTLDTVLNKKLMKKEQIFKKYNLDPKEGLILAVQHPITTLDDCGLFHMKEMFLALDKLKKQTLILYPNCDAGGMELINLIKKYEDRNYLHVFKNLPHEEYLALMKYSTLMIGNSSSGIIEAPSFKIPVINIIGRQKGRTRSENIIDVNPEKNKILKAVNYALNDNKFKFKIKKSKNKFGDGKSAIKIVKILKELKIDYELIQKQITY